MLFNELTSPQPPSVTLYRPARAQPTSLACYRGCRPSSAHHCKPEFARREARHGDSRHRNPSCYSVLESASVVAGDQCGHDFCVQGRSSSASAHQLGSRDAIGCAWALSNHTFAAVAQVRETQRMRHILECCTSAAAADGACHRPWLLALVRARIRQASVHTLCARCPAGHPSDQETSRKTVEAA